MREEKVSIRDDEATMRLGVHDASRIEWMVELPLPRAGSCEEVEIELSADVPQHVWSDHDHWEHLQLLARLSSPREEGRPAGSAATVGDVRRAALSVVHRFKERRDRIEREIFLATSLLSTAARNDLGDEILSAARAAIGELREDRDRIARAVADEPREVSRERALAAEFLSNHAVDLFSRLQRAIESQLRGPRSRHREEYGEMAARLRPFFARMLAEELAYRDAHGMLRPEEGDPWKLERYVARASQLKKRFHEVLFLQLETDRTDKRFRNWTGMIAASLAALWAFPLGFLLTGGGGVTGVGLGLSSTIALLVLSYAVKDRIKESARAWLSARIANGYGGRLTAMHAPSSLAKDEARLLRVRESFVTSRELRPDPLNPDLGTTRKVKRMRYRMVGITRGDEHLDKLGLSRAKLIFRYDLSPLFARLDDPIKQVPVLAGEELRLAEAARCYRIPVELVVRCGGNTLRESGVVVTHKLGLERFERSIGERQEVAVHDGPLAYLAFSSVRRR